MNVMTCKANIFRPRKDLTGVYTHLKHKCNKHNTSAKATLKLQKPQHKYKRHNPTAKATAQLQTSQHNCKGHNTTAKATTQLQKTQRILD